MASLQYDRSFLPSHGSPGPRQPGHGSGPPPIPVYGPLSSRRLGRSLGVDLTPPGHRVCNFDCAYCEVSRALPVQAGADAWPTPRAVAEALAIALRRCGRLDSITISGHGEPTLHPRFAAVVQCILEEALRHRPRVPVRILTNGSGAVRPEVRRALDRLDERIATIDAGAEKLDRPCPHAPLGSIVHGLTMLRDVTAQSCFVEGVVSNVGDDTVADWAELVAEIQPRRVQIYTVNRIPAACGVWPASPARLQEIASVLRARTGISADVFS